jgi:hypothetical protein
MPKKKRISNTEKQRRKTIMKQFQPSTTVNTHVQRPSIAACNVLTIDHLLTIKKPLKYPFSRFQKAGKHQTEI